MPTLNFSSSDDYIIPSNKSFTYRGLDGNDTYIISPNTISDNAKISIIDTSGSNIIQLTNGLTIDSNLFTKNAMRLYLENGAEITVSNADKFTYNVGGNATTGKTGSVKTFLELAELFGLNEVPSSGSKKGTTNLIIKNDSTSSSLEATDGDDDIKLTSSDDSFLVTPGNDTIDGGSGNDTVIIPSGSRIVPGNDETGSITEKSGKDFIWVQLEDSSTESGFSQEKTILTNFENIQISGENSITSIRNFVGTNKFTIKNLQLKDKTINDGDIKSYDMSPYFASNNYNYVRNYTISSDASNEIADQINLVTTSLDTTPFIKLSFGGTDKEYRLYKDPLTWTEAKKYSEELSLHNAAYSKSHLVIINSKEEVDGLWDEIKTILNGMNAPKVSDGGNSSYLWLGASDSDEEGNWSWIDGTNFGSLEENYWGSGGLGNEPDNYNNQDALALGIENWPSGSENNEGYGNAGFWNDIDSDNEIWYLVELDKTGISSNPILQLEGGKGGPTYDAIITIAAKENLLDTSERFGEASITFKVTMSDDDYDPDKPVITSQTNAETTLTLQEDKPGQNLVDLSYLNADEGSLKLGNITVDNKVYAHGDINKYKRFEIVNNSLKLQQESYFDADQDKFFYKYDNGEDDPFITFSQSIKNIRIDYTKNGISDSHLITFEVLDNNYGHTTQSDNNIFVFENDSPSSDNLVNQLIDQKKYKASSSEIIEILYAFAPLNDQNYIDTTAGQGRSENPEKWHDRYYDIYDENDIQLEATEHFKKTVKEVLSHYSNIVKIKFTDVSGENYDQAHWRFMLWEKEDGDVPNLGYAISPNFKATYIVINGKNGSWDSPNEKGSVGYGVILHEVGHALSLEHPFDGDEVFNSNIADKSDNTKLFSVMAYHAAWRRDTDTYNITKDGEAIPSTNVYSYLEKSLIKSSTISHHDILAYEFLYGLNEDYNKDDTLYKFSGKKSILETIHDMGGYDTIDISNFSENSKIDLRKKGVSEIGEKKLIWYADQYYIKSNQENPDYNEIEADALSGNVFVIGPKTTIEAFKGALRNNDITLDPDIKNNIITTTGSDTIRGALSTDIISTGNGSDHVYVTINNLSEISDSINIDGGLNSYPYKNYKITNISVPENQKGITILDLSFLKIDDGSFSFKTIQYDETLYSYGDINKFKRFEVIDSALKLQKDSEFDFEDKKLLYQYNPDDGSPYLTSNTITNSTYDIVFNYTSNEISYYHTVKISIRDTAEPSGLQALDNANSTLEISKIIPDSGESLDTLYINLPSINEIELDIFRTHFDNFEKYDFSDSFAQEITIKETDFVSLVNGILTINGDESDTILLPENASQTRSDDFYTYYTMNDNEIAIADTMMIG